MPHADYHYTKSTHKSIPDTIAAVQSALTNYKFSALWHLDVQAKVKEKGLDLDQEFHILEVCSAPRAKEALETNLSVGYFLPCKIVVYKKAGTTHVGLLRPTILMEILGDERLTPLALEVDEALRKAVDEAVQ